MRRVEALTVRVVVALTMGRAEALTMRRVEALAMRRAEALIRSAMGSPEARSRAEAQPIRAVGGPHCKKCNKGNRPGQVVVEIPRG